MARLKNPVTLEVHRLDHAGTPKDTQARRGTLVHRYLEPISVAAQLDFASRRSRQREALAGADVLTRATAIVVISECRRKGWSEPQKGDRVPWAYPRSGDPLALGGVGVDGVPSGLYVQSCVPFGARRGGDVYFELTLVDEEPSRR